MKLATQEGVEKLATREWVEKLKLVSDFICNILELLVIVWTVSSVGIVKQS